MDRDLVKARMHADQLRCCLRDSMKAYDGSHILERFDLDELSEVDIAFIKNCIMFVILELGSDILEAPDDLDPTP